MLYIMNLSMFKTDYNKRKFKILIDDEEEKETDLVALNDMVSEKT